MATSPGNGVYMKKMRKQLLVLLLLLGSFGAGAQEIRRWKLADMEAAIRNTTRPTIFNFWATFCKPCIEEIPHFQELQKKYAADGVELVLVSLDMPELYPQKLQAFMKKRKFTAPAAFLDESNADLFCPAVDASWSGAIPATLFVNHTRGYRFFIEEPLKKERLEAEIRKMVGKEVDG